MAAGHQGKIDIVTGVIAFVPDSFITELLVGNFKTVTGGANKCTGIATDAVGRYIFKFRGVKLSLHFFVYLRVVHL